MTQINDTLDAESCTDFFTSSGKVKAFAKLLEYILNQVLTARLLKKLSLQLNYIDEGKYAFYRT